MSKLKPGELMFHPNPNIVPQETQFHTSKTPPKTSPEKKSPPWVEKPTTSKPFPKQELRISDTPEQMEQKRKRAKIELEAGQRTYRECQAIQRQLEEELNRALGNQAFILPSQINSLKERIQQLDSSYHALANSLTTASQILTRENRDEFKKLISEIQITYRGFRTFSNQKLKTMRQTSIPTRLSQWFSNFFQN